MKRCPTCRHPLAEHVPAVGTAYDGWCGRPECECEGADGPDAPVVPVTLYVVAGDSAHFSFRAYGLTADQAMDAYRTLIRRHTRDFGAFADWAESMINDATPVPVRTGAGYRDGEEITR